jgi:DNA-binding response OmpR family regulator
LGRILIVEDDAISAKALSMILEHKGWHADVAETYAKAMDRLSDSYHAVILDLMLPDGDGIDLLQYIRRMHSKILVAVTTGASDPEYLKRLGAFSPDMVLPKPIDLPALLRGLGPVS